jgi:hypothetical protein
VCDITCARPEGRGRRKCRLATSKRSSGFARAKASADEYAAATVLQPKYSPGKTKKASYFLVKAMKFKNIFYVTKDFKK